MCATVEEPPRTTPPSSPANGSAYIVAAGATGPWAGKGGCLAAYSEGGWRFVQPFEGLAAYVRSTAVSALYRSGDWELGVVRGSKLLVGGQQVVGPRGSAITSPTGGTSIDTQARTVIGQILAALRLHGLIEA